MKKHRIALSLDELKRLLRGIRLSVISVQNESRAQMQRASDRVDLLEPYFQVLAEDKAIEERLEKILESLRPSKTTRRK